MQRVAVTGIGIICPLGLNRAEVVESLRRSKSGIRSITRFDAEGLQCRIAGEVPLPLDEARFKGLDRFTRLALVAAEEAASQSRFDLASFIAERTGCVIGTGLGGCEALDTGYHRIYAEGATRVAPLTIPASMYNAATSAVSQRFGTTGSSFAVVSACSSSVHAVGLAAQSIRLGQADAMFAGGADAPLTFGILRAWEALRVLAGGNEEPEKACRPFSLDRRGLVLAEGAAVLLLESFDHATERGQPILGEIAGFGSTSDAGHLTDPSAGGAARAMRLALRDAGAAPGEVGYINAHGTGTRANDAVETAAIHEVFREAARKIPVSSTKSMHGHAMGASGAIETALSLLCANEGFIPPTINLDVPDPACDLDYVPHQPRQREVGLFLSNSFGFGGMNAVLTIRTALAPSS